MDSTTKNDTTNVALSNTVLVADIVDTDRQRKNYGDVAGLAASIKQFGLIQPIVLQKAADGGNSIILVAGGRRLAALRLNRYTTLNHGKEYIWRDENLSTSEGRLRLQAVELEENLRRQDLTWPEVIAAKARLLTLMQSIHGVSRGFGAGRSASDDGFGIRTLAAMLGENPSTTSRDIELAGYVAKHPMLAQLPTRADAQRKLGVAVTVAAMQSLAKKSQVPASYTLVGNVNQTSGDATTTVGDEPQPGDSSLITVPKDERWTLYEGKFQNNIVQIADESVDLVVTDLPYNIGLGTSSASHSAGLGTFADDNLDIVQLSADVAVESFRVLRNNRFAVFFYGMNYHGVLYDALTTAGFIVDVYPFIWLRDRSAPPDGFARYSKTYDPAFICSKGCPRFIRPNLANSIAIPSVRGAERLHAAQKPLAIMQKFIEDMTTEGCIVLDPFAGSGTTGEAALRTRRKCILFELEPANCILIRSRLGVL